MQLALDLLLDSEPSFENFIVGANQELVSFLREPKSVWSALCLWGEAASGKSHLLKSLARDTQTQGHNVFFTSGAELSSLREQLSLQRPADMLVIDDVDMTPKSSWDDLFALQNLYRNQSKRLVLSSSSSPTALHHYFHPRDDISSRIAWGTIFQLHTLSDEEKAAALIRFFEQRGAEFGADVPTYLLTHQSRNIKNLIMLASKIDRYAYEQKRAITLPLVRQFFSSSSSL